MGRAPGAQNRLKIRFFIILTSLQKCQDSEKYLVFWNEFTKTELKTYQYIHSINILNEEYKIGIIDLPNFYIDFDAYRDRDPDYKSSSNDVKKILKEFNKKSVDAVIIDLRGNSGGNAVYGNWNQIWSGANDGAGSGLDADK